MYERKLTLQADPVNGQDNDFYFDSHDSFQEGRIKYLSSLSGDKDRNEYDQYHFYLIDGPPEALVMNRSYPVNCINYAQWFDDLKTFSTMSEYEKLLFIWIRKYLEQAPTEALEDAIEASRADMKPSNALRHLIQKSGKVPVFALEYINYDDIAKDEILGQIYKLYDC